MLQLVEYRPTQASVQLSRPYHVIAETADMNTSGFVESTEAYVNHTVQQSLEEIYATVFLLKRIIEHVVLVLGIPGNILSAIVWLRRHMASKNSSAVYLAALAINDLVYLLELCLVVLIMDLHPSPRDALNNWFFHHVMYFVRRTAPYLELMLVLSFSIERLIAILLPLQVYLSRVACGMHCAWT